MAKKESEEISKIVKFSKKDFINSEKYKKYSDFLSYDLQDNETYSCEEVENKIKEFLKREVN